MDYQLEKVILEKKDVLFNLLQFSLYDGSQYSENSLNEDGKFEYSWFDKYFQDESREAFFIKYNHEYIGFVMINENLKVCSTGKSVAEFLIMPKYRRKHIGRKVAIDIFNMHQGYWEVEPLENSEQAYYFWEKTIREYTGNKYEINDYNNSKIFVFKSINK